MVQRAPARRRKKTNAGPDGMMTMFVLKTNPLAEVDGFSLPSGARVAVVTSKPAAARSVARRLAERIQSDGFLVRVAQAETGRQETPRTDAKLGSTEALSSLTLVARQSFRVSASRSPI